MQVEIVQSHTGGGGGGSQGGAGSISDLLRGIFG